MARFSRDGGGSFGGGNRGGSFGGNRGGFGGARGGSRFGDRDREVTMHDAVCAECKQTCQVPFRPTNERPVYCKDCFTKRGGPDNKSDFKSAPRRDFDRRDDRRSDTRPAFTPNTGDGEVKKQLESLNFKLDKLIKLFEGGVKPVVTEAKMPVKEVLKAVKEMAPAKTKKVSKAKKTAKK